MRGARGLSPGHRPAPGATGECGAAAGAVSCAFRLRPTMEGWQGHSHPCLSLARAAAGHGSRGVPHRLVRRPDVSPRGGDLPGQHEPFGCPLMAKTLPLSKTRLHELLQLYDGRMVLKEEGGYDWGVYFHFKGRMRVECQGSRSIVAGRVAGNLGFCSESICITRGELLCRDSKAGLDSFWRRVAARRATLEGWLEAFYTANTEALHATNDDR